jgi:hypothetical protein
MHKVKRTKLCVLSFRCALQHSLLVATAGLLLCGALGCEKDASPDAQPAAEAEAELDPTAIDTEEREHLRALGYTDVAPPITGEAGVVLHDAERASQGLNFFTNSQSCSAQIMDMEGKLLHEWSYQPCYRWANASLLQNGDILVVGKVPYDKKDPDADLLARYMMRLSFDGRVLWKKNLAAHHDIELTPDGHIATLKYSYRIESDLNRKVPVRDEQLVLATLDGEIVRELSILSLMRAASSAHKIKRVRKRTFEGKTEIDLIHSNSVEFMRHPELAKLSPLYAPTNALLSIRHQDAIVIIDTEKEEIVFSWGKKILSGPHDATVLPDGHILIFDNGLGRDWSRIVELDPLSREIVWEYRAPAGKSFYTHTRGSNQRLSNGNTLIVESGEGFAFEITPEGDRVWEFINFNMTKKREPIVIVRMRRYEGLSFETLRERAAAGNLEMRD